MAGVVKGEARSRRPELRLGTGGDRHHRLRAALLCGVVLAALAAPLVPAVHLAAAGPSLCRSPSVSAVTDSSGTQHWGVPGQTVVTVSGSGFSESSCTVSVTIGPAGRATTVSAQNLTLSSSGSALSFVLPAGPGGAVTVLLTDRLGNSASSNGNLHFYALPTASLATPDPSESSTTTVTGSNFTFGGAVSTPPAVLVCDGSDPSMKPAAMLASDTSLSFMAPRVYCDGPVQLTFQAPYDSTAAAAGRDTPVSMPVGAGILDIGARVTSFSHGGSISPGQAITVSGSGFGPTGSASLGGLPVPTAWSDQALTATIPADASSGLLVFNRAADGAAVVTGTVAVAALVQSVTPSLGSAGDTVSMVGAGFGAATGTVQLAGLAATVLAWTPTALSFTIPGGAHDGPLVITPAVNLPPPEQFFRVLPRIEDVVPTSASGGTLAALRGTGFGSRPGQLLVAGQPASTTIWTDQLVVFTVPQNLAAGPASIVLTTAGPAGESGSLTGFSFNPAAIVPGGAPDTSLILPGRGGKPIVSTRPVQFTPPPQTGPVVVSIDVPQSAAAGSDVPYTVTVEAFGAPVSELKVSVVIALEPATDARISNATSVTDANGQVHGYVHLSAVPGDTLLLAMAGPYRNEVELVSISGMPSSAAGTPFLVTHLANGGAAVVMLTLLGLLAIVLSMSRGRELAVAGAPSARRRRVSRTAAATAPLIRRARTVLLDPDRPMNRAVRRRWEAHRDLFWRVVGIGAGVVLILVYLVASISTLTAIPLAVGFGSSAVVPEGGLYYVASVLVSLALTAIAIRYIYYYRCWAVSRHFFHHPVTPDPALLATRPLPNLKIQVTTKGGALPVVERSVAELDRIVTRHPWLRSKVSVEVITEVAEEVEYLARRFDGAVLPVYPVQLPPEYQTPNGTKLKARALHYMVERRRQGWNRREGRTFIVHFDEETLVTEAHLLVLVDYLSGTPRAVSQGPIVYPLEWKKTPWICRALESTRPFGCSECARVMENPPPPHLHGSNLVVDEDAENRIGWDFGTLDGQPFIAEDLLFGLRVFSVMGREAFGWHGATMMEQPPLSLHWAVQQRLRWVMGAMQGLRAMATSSEYDGIARAEKKRLFTSIGFRIATYSLGFPVGFAGLYFLIHPVTTATQWASLFGLWRGLIIFSALAWIVSYQIGIARNLRYQAVSRKERIQHALAMLVMTPVAGLCETIGPFIALLRWLFGARRASWTPTPKLTDKRPSPEGATVLATDARGGEEVIGATGPAVTATDS